jgi:DNA helicase-2/ATP-dependent DNA helicase PcrA
MEKATISYANNRYKWGTSQPSRPSRFIKDIDPEFLVFPDYSSSDNTTKDFSFSEKEEGNLNKNFASSSNPKRKLKKIGNSPQKKSGSGSAKGEYKGEFKPGMIVEHNRFGKGTIVEIVYPMPNSKATIHFEKSGEKTLLLKFAKLKIISQ